MSLLTHNLINTTCQKTFFWKHVKEFLLQKFVLSKTLDRHFILNMAGWWRKEEMNMKIGQKLKEARTASGLSQENVAEKINVSRQTISNWENEKTYPDIISVIKLSDLYSISLDALLKGDDKMMKHLEESTNVVKSNQKLIGAILINIVLVAVIIILSMFIPDNQIYLLGVFCLMVISSSVLLYQIIQKI